MEKDQVLDVIEKTILIAQSRGAFKLEEAATINLALIGLKELFKEEEPVENTADKKPAPKKSSK